MPGILETLGAMAGTDLGKAINLAHTTFQDRMGEHNHFGRALLETVAKVAREHPNLMGIGAALLVEAIILAEKRHSELHPNGGGLPHVNLPHVSVPQVNLPHISTPHVDLPHLHAPQVHLDHIKPGKVALEVFGGLMLLKFASFGAKMFRRRQTQEVWFAPAAKIHLISGTLAAYYIAKSISSPKISSWRNAAAALFATDALKPVLKAPKRPKGAATTQAQTQTYAAATPVAPTPAPVSRPVAAPETGSTPTESPPSAPAPTLAAESPSDTPASSQARAALSPTPERLRAPPPPADSPAFWTPPPRSRDLPTGEIIQWTGFSNTDTTGPTSH